MIGANIEFEDLLDFGRRFPSFAGELLETFAHELHAAAHARVAELAIEATPRGSSSRPGHVHMVSSWQSSPGYLAAIAAGKPTAIVSKVPHAGIVEGGAPKFAAGHKRRTKSGSVTVAAGRQIGSFQAPLGIRSQVLQRVNAELDALGEEVGRRVFGQTAGTGGGYNL